MPEIDPKRHYILERADLDARRGSKKNIHVNCVAQYVDMTRQEALDKFNKLIDEDIMCDCRIIDSEKNIELVSYHDTYDFS